MLRQTLPVLTAAALILGVPAAAGAAAATSPPLTKVLPISTPGPLAVDGPHKHLFVADPSDQSILVTDYAGNTTGTISGVSQISDLLVSDRLYVATSDSIVAYDTGDLVEVAAYPTGGVLPTVLAQAGGRIWFAYQSGLGSLDPDGTARLFPQLGGIFSGPPRLAASPGAPGQLVESGLGITNLINVVDVSTGTPAVTVSRSGLGTPGSTPGVAMSPDGTQVVATGPQGLADVLAVSDLTTIGSFNVSSFPSAPAVAADGTVVISESDAQPPDVALFTPGTADPTTRLPIVISGSDYAGDSVRALALEPDGPRVFVIASGTTGVVSLQVLNQPVAMATTAQISAPARAVIGRKLTVQGQITATVPPAGLPVTITRTDARSPGGVQVGPATLDASGAFSFVDRPPALGTTTYTVTFNGDDTYLPSSATAVVTVVRRWPTR